VAIGRPEQQAPLARCLEDAASAIAITTAFVQAMERCSTQHAAPLIRFDKGRRNEEVAVWRARAWYHGSSDQ
jgi:hypothetical protein